MHPVLNHNLFLVKEHLGFFKAARNFDVYDPETGEMILLCREPHLGPLTKMLRFTDYKKMTPFDIRIQTPSGEPVARVSRGVSLFLSTVKVYDDTGTLLGGFKQKFFSVGGAFDVLDASDQIICSLQGKWTAMEYRFLARDQEIARVTKKWTGIGQELFTSANNYMLQIAGSVPPDNPIRELILAAVFCIDMVLKE